MDFKIIIDSREQTAWSFPKWVKIETKKIDAGDYALNGDEANFSIERKELNDFVGTICVNYDRFDRELARMKHYPARIVIIEGLLTECLFTEKENEIIPPKHNHYKITPQFIMKRIAELSLMGVSILFAENAQIASALAYRILLERYNEIKNKNN